MRATFAWDDHAALATSLTGIASGPALRVGTRGGSPRRRQCRSFHAGHPSGPGTCRPSTVPSRSTPTDRAGTQSAKPVRPLQPLISVVQNPLVSLLPRTPGRRQGPPARRPRSGLHAAAAPAAHRPAAASCPGIRPGPQNRSHARPLLPCFHGQQVGSTLQSRPKLHETNADNNDSVKLRV